MLNRTLGGSGKAQELFTVGVSQGDTSAAVHTRLSSYLEGAQLQKLQVGSFNTGEEEGGGAR